MRNIEPIQHSGPTGNHRLKRFWREWIKPLLIVLLIVSAVRSTLADWNDVPTGSMIPTILEGDRIVVNKLAYDLKVPFTTWRLKTWSHPSRGDIVVFFSPADGKRLVKRVVGLPGDRVEMVNNRLHINGQPVDYQPLPASAYTSGNGKQGRVFGFALEMLGEHPHPVMVTPTLTSRRSFPAIQIPEDQYFMMGDNRDNSFDSRYFGFVPRNQIIGRALAVALSVDLARHYLPRWERFFSPLN